MAKEEVLHKLMVSTGDTEMRDKVRNIARARHIPEKRVCTYLRVRSLPRSAVFPCAFCLLLCVHIDFARCTKLDCGCVKVPPIQMPRAGLIHVRALCP